MGGNGGGSGVGLCLVPRARAQRLDGVSLEKVVASLGFGLGKTVAPRRVFCRATEGFDDAGRVRAPTRG